MRLYCLVFLTLQAARAQDPVKRINKIRNFYDQHLTRLDHETPVSDKNIARAHQWTDKIFGDIESLDTTFPCEGQERIDNFEEDRVLVSDDFCKDNGKMGTATRSFVRKYGCNVKKNFANAFQKRTRRLENIFHRIADCQYEQTPEEEADIERITLETNSILNEIEEKNLASPEQMLQLRNKWKEEILRAKNTPKITTHGRRCNRKRRSSEEVESFYKPVSYSDEEISRMTLSLNKTLEQDDPITAISIGIVGSCLAMNGVGKALGRHYSLKDGAGCRPSRFGKWMRKLTKWINWLDDNICHRLFKINGIW
jgi:plasmid stabilization system protein ParE